MVKQFYKYMAVICPPLQKIDVNVAVNMKYIMLSSSTNMRFHISCSKPIYLQAQEADAR